MLNYSRLITAVLKSSALLLKTALSFISFLLIITALTGCASFHTKVSKARIGLTKKQTLKRFSEPQEKYRTKGLDHWVYETSKRAKDKSQGKIAYRHILIFNEGVLMGTKLERSFTNKELLEFKNN